MITTIASMLLRVFALEQAQASSERSMRSLRLFNTLQWLSLVATFNLVLGTFSDSGVQAQQGSRLFSRPLPVGNFNLGRPGENPNRSNIRWFNARPSNSGDEVDVGDDFRIGANGERYLIRSLKVWVVTLATQDADPSNPDLRNSHPQLSLLGGKVNQGVGGLSLVRSATAGSSTISFSRVRYAGGVESYWTLPSGREEPVWEVVFNDLNWIVDGGETYQFFVGGTRVLQTSGTVQIGVPLHASNAALSGATQEGADGFYRLLRNVNGTPTEAGTINSNPSGTAGDYQSGGWNKSSDINVEVYGDKLVSVSGTVYSRAGSAVSGATIRLGSYSGISDSNGSYTLTNVAPGTYNLVGENTQSSFVPRGFQNPLIVSSATQTGKDLIENAFLLEGRLNCDPSGGVEVSAGGVSTRTRSGQAFKLSGLGAGSYTLAATYPGMSFDSQNVTVSDSDLTGLLLRGRSIPAERASVGVSNRLARISLQTWDGYPAVYLVQIKSLSDGETETFLSSSATVTRKNLPLGSYEVRYQAGIGEFGKRIATQFSPWVRFGVQKSKLASKHRASKPVSKKVAVKLAKSLSRLVVH